MGRHLLSGSYERWQAEREASARTNTSARARAHTHTHTRTHAQTHKHAHTILVPARALQMGFFAEAGPLQIFVSSHVSGMRVTGFQPGMMAASLHP